MTTIDELKCKVAKAQEAKDKLTDGSRKKHGSNHRP